MKLPMMFMDDAIKSTLKLMNADRNKLSINSSYNVAAMSFTPYQLAKEITKHVSDFKVSYKPDFRNNIASSWPNSISDELARTDWGWQHEYDITKTTSIMLSALRKKMQLETNS